MAAKPLRKRVSDFEEVAGDISGVRFAHLRLYLDTLDAHVSTIEAEIGRLNSRMSAMETRIEALPRAIAEMLDERDKRKQ
jgi:hypothetical protein